MDTLSHGLYGGIAFGRRSWKDYLVSFLFGVGPDILSFGPFFVAVFFGWESWVSRGYEKPDPAALPGYVHSLYDAAHSFLIYGLFFMLLWLRRKNNFARLTLSWPLHILIDIPTHSGTFFPTPFLWPISDFYVDGHPWSNPEIFIPNVVLLVGLYAYWYTQRRVRK
ncbi:MAG: hypothetical protein V1856_02435 [Candidatus Liptonbacteria bacterium]